MKNIPFRKVLVFILITTALLTILQWGAKTAMNNYNVGQLGKVNRICTGNLSESISIWGASTAYVHFDPQIIASGVGKTCYNAGLDGTSFSQYRGLVNHYIHSSATGKDKDIILTFDLSGLRQRKNIQNNQFWLHHLDKPDVYETLAKIDYQTTFRFRYAPFYYLTLVGANARPFLFKYFNSQIKNTPLKETELNGFKPNQRVWNQKQVEAEAKIVFAKEQPDFDLNVAKDIENTIREAKAKNFRVTLVLTPCYIDGLNQIKNADAIALNFDSLAKKNNVVFFNYLRAPFHTNQEYFYNNTHLNQKGATELSRLFVQDFNQTYSK